MALPTFTIPSTVYTVPVQRELNNQQLEGEGVRITLLRENIDGGIGPPGWPEGPIATLTGELNLERGGQPVWQPWVQVALEGGDVFRDGVLRTTSVKTAYWPGENDGQGGRRKLKGDIRITLVPAQTFRTTITAEII